jgi:HlyD family secretion protein
VVLLLALAGVAGGLAWWFNQRDRGPRELALYGNIDLRQVELAFNGNERIAAVLVQEGERVKRGEVVARLDTIEPQVAQAEAQVAALRQVIEKLHNGARPEEIAQARANVEAVRAEASRARQQYERAKTLSDRSGGRAVSQQDLENATAALDVAEGRLAVAQKQLDLIVAGARKEDVAAAEAKLRAGEAQLAFLKAQLKETQLISPVDAVVRTRIMEPGEIAFPQKPVLSLAITDPKWVRAYVSEPDLGKVKPGLAASVAVDSFPGRRFDGWIGFVSPVAEFTPKAVQVEDLRTSLVYEVRVFVKDPSDELRLGMPATVYLQSEHRGPETSATQPATAPAEVAPASDLTEGSSLEGSSPEGGMGKRSRTRRSLPVALDTPQTRTRPFAAAPRDVSRVADAEPSPLATGKLQPGVPGLRLPMPPSRLLMTDDSPTGVFAGAIPAEEGSK